MSNSFLIRNLPEGVKTELRVRAARNGRSMEEEAHVILAAALAPPGEQTSGGLPWGLGETAWMFFGPENGIDLDLPPREPMRGPPDFSWAPEGEDEEAAGESGSGGRRFGPVIFLDTDVVSELLRSRPDPGVLERSVGSPREEVCIASAVEAELRAGVERLPDGRRGREAGRALEGFLRAAFGRRVFPFDRAAAPIYAGFVAARRRAGRPVSVPDALIAATARAHGATLLATRDTSGFEGCGVALANS